MDFHLILWITIIIGFNTVNSHNKTEDVKEINDADLNAIFNSTRRILNGKQSHQSRPYMVYLVDATNNTRFKNWLCGGVIIHPYYVVTSAACIEEVELIYVISGTNNWAPLSEQNICMNNSATRVVWKCMPKSYEYDGMKYNNQKWMQKDLAVLKVDEPFNFTHLIKGCDYIPMQVLYNRYKPELEDPGTEGFAMGWGSVSHYSDPNSNITYNSPYLLEADVVVISRNSCKELWPASYHYTIDNFMICTAETTGALLASYCKDQIKCKGLVYDRYTSRRQLSFNKTDSLNKTNIHVHLADHKDLMGTRRESITGGFCENDHGGPLIVGHGNQAMLVGIISACIVRENSKCEGPFLYTSVYQLRNVIICSIDKDYSPEIARMCKEQDILSRTEQSTYDWSKL